MIARARTPTTRKTPWPRGCPRCSARARPGRASQSVGTGSIMRFVKLRLYLRHGFFKILIAAQALTHRTQAKPGSQRSQSTFHKEFQFVLAFVRNPHTGTFCASEGEPRISSDISQWTDSYSIASGRLLAPSSSLNLPLAISMGPHGRCWERPTLSHIFESF